MKDLLKKLLLFTLPLVFVLSASCNDSDDDNKTPEEMIIGIWEPITDDPSFNNTYLSFFVFKSDKTAIRYVIDEDKSDESGFVFSDTINFRNYTIYDGNKEKYITCEIDEDNRNFYDFKDMTNSLVFLSTSSGRGGYYKKVKSINVKK